MHQVKESFPLQWPIGYERTQYPVSSQFGKHTLDQATTFVINEIMRLGGRDEVISSNIPTKKNGLPRSDYQRSIITDRGVAVYFIRKGKQQVIACDAFKTVEENLWAIARTIENMRGIERYKCSDIMNRTFAGLTPELPMLAQAIDYWSILDIEPTKDKEAIRKRYLYLAKERSYDEVMLRDLNTARDLAYKYADE